MKTLSRAEMKNVIGGTVPAGCYGAMVYCNDGWHDFSTNECSNSVGFCNAHGGFAYCRGSFCV